MKNFKKRWIVGKERFLVPLQWTHSVCPPGCGTCACHLALTCFHFFSLFKSFYTQRGIGTQDPEIKCCRLFALSQPGALTRFHFEKSSNIAEHDVKSSQDLGCLSLTRGLWITEQRGRHLVCGLARDLEGPVTGSSQQTGVIWASILGRKSLTSWSSRVTLFAGNIYVEYLRLF